MPRGVYARKDRSSKRDEILQTAMRIYARQGFEGTTIEQIAEAAGVSKTLVLRYFASKQDLVRELADRAAENVLRRLRGLERRPGLTLRRREALVHGHLRRYRDEWCVVVGTLLVPKFAFRARGVFAAYHEVNLRAVMARLEELREPAEDAARAYAHTAWGLHMGYLIDGMEDAYRHAMRRHMDLYLLPDKGESPE